MIAMSAPDRDVGERSELVRVSVYLDRGLAALVQKAARIERRNVSAEVAIAIERYIAHLRETGVMPAEE